MTINVGFVKNIIPKRRIITSRFLIVVATTLMMLNVVSVKVFPATLRSVSASSIDVNELVALANSERVARGLAPLTIDSRLVEAAQNKGNDMLEKDYWAHYGPNGESPWQFILAAEYDYVFAGENLAKDFTSTAPIHNAWMESPSHRANIINSNYEDIGIAMVTGDFLGEETTIVVQMFGSVRDEVSSSPVLSSPVTTTVHEEDVESELAKPVIQEPKDGSILNDGAFSVRGESYDGQYIELYDKDVFVTELVVGNKLFSFIPDTNWDEGIHSISARATDIEGNESPLSDIVDITLDTISPYIVHESFVLNYIEAGSGFTNYIIKVEVKDNPITVSAAYRGTSYSFHPNEGMWECSINTTNSPSGEIVVSAVDGAGNSATDTFYFEDLMKFIDSSGEISSEKQEWGEWFVDNALTRLFTRSLQGQINFFITLCMLLLIIVERVTLAKTGMTEVKPVSLLHIPVFAMLLFVSVLGGGGQIL